MQRAEPGFTPAASLTEQIADHIADDIIRGRMAPQERIRELRVARSLGVSRGSVREALLLLERRHLIEIVPRRGAVVADLSRRQLDDLYEILETLYGRIARRMADLLADLESEMREDGIPADLPLSMEELLQDARASQAVEFEEPAEAVSFPLRVVLEPDPLAEHDVG